MLIQMQVTQNLREDLKNLKVRVIFVTEIKRSKKKLFFLTCRKLEAIYFSLSSTIKYFENKYLFWYTANFAGGKSGKQEATYSWAGDKDFESFI